MKLVTKGFVFSPLYSLKQWPEATEMAVNGGGQKVNILTKVVCGRFERNEVVFGDFFLSRNQM